MLLSLLMAPAILVFLAVIGTATLVMLEPGEDAVTQSFVASAVGLCVILVPAYWLARLGVPIHSFGLPLLGFQLLSSVLILLVKKRSPFAKPAVIPLVLTSLIAIILVSWPLAEFGSDWIAFANGDWTFYLVNAEALYRNGFSIPDLSGFSNYRDIIASGSYNLYSTGRQGTEILIAEFMALFQQRSHAVYMPLLVVGQVLITQTAMALLWLFVKSQRAAIIAGALVAVSPLLTYGLIFQLLPQQLGIALLSLSLWRLFSPRVQVKSNSLRGGLLTGITLAGSVLVYPELSTFIVLAFFTAFAATIFRRRNPFRLALTAALGLFAALVLIFSDIVPATHWIIGVAARPKLTPQEHTIIYPQFLQLEGFLDFWGLHAIGTGLGNYTVAVALLGLALLLTGILCYATIDLTLAFFPPALILLPMIAVGARFIATRDDFAIYKLAMYSQPFAISLIVGWFAFRILRISPGTAKTWRTARLSRAPIVALALFLFFAQARVQFQYLLRSAGTPTSPGGVNIRGGSDERLISNLEEDKREYKESSFWVLDEANDKPSYALASIAFDGAGLLPTNPYVLLGSTDRVVVPPPFVKQAYEPAFAKRNAFLLTKSVSFGSAAPLAVVSMDRRVPLLLDNSGTTYIASVGPFNALNQWQTQTQQLKTQIASMTNVAQLRNRLVFIPSSLGLLWAYGPFSLQTLDSPEHDNSFDRSGWYQALNRYMLVAGQRLDKKVRVVLSLTMSPVDPNASLPPASITGSGHLAFGFVGRGSGRLISEPITPKSDLGLKLMLLDLGVAGKPHTNTLPGIFSLFNGDIKLDPRYISAYTRDFSVVSESDFLHLRRPSDIVVPRDLSQRTVEYSGLWEDGWGSTNLFATVSHGRRPMIQVSGFIPRTTDNAQERYPVEISANGVRERRVLPPGEFVETIDIARSSQSTLGMRFSKSIKLGFGDPRAVGAYIRDIGFPILENDLSQGVPASTNGKVMLGSGWYAHESYQGQSFRWTPGGAEIILKPDRMGNATIIAEVSGGPSLPQEQNFAVQLLDDSGQVLGNARVYRTGTIRFKVKTNRPETSFILRTACTQRRFNGDSRVLGLRVFGISVR